MSLSLEISRLIIAWVSFSKLKYQWSLCRLTGFKIEYKIEYRLRAVVQRATRSRGVGVRMRVRRLASHHSSFLNSVINVEPDHDWRLKTPSKRWNLPLLISSIALECHHSLPINQKSTVAVHADKSKDGRVDYCSLDLLSLSLSPTPSTAPYKTAADNHDPRVGALVLGILPDSGGLSR